MTAQPGTDEIETRNRLRQLLGEEPDAAPAAPSTPAAPPKPTARPRDWLDDVLDGNATPADAPVEEAPSVEPDQPAEQPAKPKAGKPRKPKRGTRNRKRGGTGSTRAPAARSAWDSQPADPRQSLAEAWDRVPYRLKWLAFHAAAAAVGWRLGLVGWSTNTAAWYAAGHWTSPSAWVLYALGGAVWALHRRTRSWARPIAWAATIPVSSVVVGVLLYGTGYHP